MFYKKNVKEKNKFYINITTYLANKITYIYKIIK